MSSTTTNTSIKSDYIQPSSLHPYDSSQNPLALLAQTCSSIGKDCTSTSLSSPPTITSHVTKSLSNLSNSDKSFSSTKRSSPTQTNQINSNKKSSFSSKSNLPTISSKEYSYPSSLFDPTTSVAALLLRSSLAYLASQQQQQHCTIPGCSQCETARYLFTNSLNTPPYLCHGLSSDARFPSNHQLTEHIRYNHRSSKLSDNQRFHPYLKPSKMIYTNDQLPYFYPHLSLSPMTKTTQCVNNNLDNNN